MIQEKEKISSTDAIVRMINAINSDMDADFYKVVHEFANTLAYGGNNRQRILSAVKLKPTRLRKLDDMPSEIKKLLIQGNKEENVFLTNEIKSLVETLLVEWKNADVYKMHNISPRNKILLHGPTGNGKTTIARYIARESNLPFIEINSDLVIDSHLGSTSGNIYKIIAAIKEPSVLFWDEVDSIGSRRSGNGQGVDTENSRMVNSLLVNLEKLDDNVIFIGATNRMDILDSAFTRRFDVKIEIPTPTLRQLQEYVVQLTQYHKLTDHIMGIGLEGIESYSDAKLKVIEKARQYLISTL